jgi:hypothetical protein
MADADNALRDELEKVRERARLQALAQGVSPEEAEQRGNTAVNEFCAKWGIRPEMLGPRAARTAEAAAKAPATPSRPVDLGSSPLRSSGGPGPGQSQVIRIGDLLKKAQDAAAGSPAAARHGSALSGLLSRAKSQHVFDPATSPTPPGGTAMPQGVPLRPAPTSPAMPPPAPPRSPSVRDPFTSVPGSPGSPAAEKRRQILEEFDRTYAEVQAMIEQRIGVGDTAMSDRAGAGVTTGAQSGPPQELVMMAEDVLRLRSQLEQMLAMCDDFLARYRDGTGEGPGGGR